MQMEKRIPKHITSLPPGDAFRCVYGIMANPDNSDRQEEFVSWANARAALGAQSGDPIRLSRETVERLLRGAERGLGQDTSQRTTMEGLQAAHVLLGVLKARAAGVQDVGIKKAVFLASDFSQKLSRELRKRPEQLKEEPPGSSTDTVEKNWDRFRSVAHLWAAYTLVDSPPDSSEFLGIAHGLFLTACAHRLPRTTYMLMDRERCWELEGVEPIYRELDPLSPEDVEVLKRA
jgi:hypothetical protein